ncbi:hypothetical protein MNBD_NITROSPINAE04-280 [hydrothermal vent metagenome]|uniref:Transmembrane protein n=1 Tax=hydrothermal vent metagenome TaxID=652676 RepID=A0A3B1BUG9_9ZZZZ
MNHVSFKIIVVTVFICCAPGVAPGASGNIVEHDPNLILLMDSFKKVQKMEARFTGVKTMSILKEPLRISGTLKYVAPSYIEKHITHPVNERYVADGGTMTVENISKNESKTFPLEQYPPLWAFIEGFRATLAGDLKTLNRFYEISFTEAERWNIVLKPKLSQMLETIKTIDIFGRKNQIMQVNITSPSGDISVMSIFPEPK